MNIDELIIYLKESMVCAVCIVVLRAFKKFSSHICISNDSENRIFPICPLYSLGDQLPIYILGYIKRTIIVVPTLDFCTSV